jgi:lambda family phage portal protein
MATSNWFSKIIGAAYDMAERSKQRRDLRSYGRGTPADEDRLSSGYDRDMARVRCHDLRRNNPIVAGICDRFADNVVGPAGLIPEAQTEDENWNREAESYFREWAKAADVRERLNLKELCRLAVTSRLFDGEQFYLFTPDGKLAPIEAERCRKPADELDFATQSDGIRMDSVGRVTDFCFHGRDKNGAFSGEHEKKWYPARDVVHVARIWRVDQVRGVPDFAPIANVLADIGEINTATLSKAKLDALAAWIINKAGGAANPSFSLRSGNQTAKTVGSTPLSKADFGMIFEAEPGETLTSFNSNTPGTQYGPFMEFNLMLACAGIGMPFEFVMMWFSKGNFSSSRAALMQAARTIESWQAWLIDNMLDPIWQWKIAQAIKRGMIPPAPTKFVAGHQVSQWYQVDWTAPPMDWIDPQNAIQTEMQEDQIGASNLSKINRRRGQDFEAVIRRKARDLRMVDRIAQEEGVDPSRLTFVQIPGQQNGGQQAQDQEQAEQNGQDSDKNDDVKSGKGLEKWLN